MLSPLLIHCRFHNLALSHRHVYFQGHPWSHRRNIPDHARVAGTSSGRSVTEPTQILSCGGIKQKKVVRMREQTCRQSQSKEVQRNYANSVYGVANICHQVRCLRWGHPSLFHTATSLWIWYKMSCMRNMSSRLIWMESINMLSVYPQYGTHGCFNWRMTAVLT